MKTRKTWLIVLAAITALTVAVSSINAEKKAAQPSSNAFGQTFGEWLRDYVAWLYGSGPGPMPQNNVLYLPIPNHGVLEDWDGKDIWVDETNVTMKTGTKFVLPILCWYGETYDPNWIDPMTGVPIPDDQPWSQDWFLPPLGEVEVLLDGVPLVNAANQADLYFGPIAFKDTIWYDEASVYHSIGAIWCQGIGVIVPPLSAGKHTLTLYSWDSWQWLYEDYDENTNEQRTWHGIGWQNTWHITVQPPGKK